MNTNNITEDVSTVYIFNYEKSKLLMVFHNKLLKWLPPGGHVKDSESYINAAKREVKEEIGIEIKIEKIIYDNEIQYSLHHTIYPSEGEEFCIVEEVILDSIYNKTHIHMDHIFVSFLDESIKITINSKETSKYKWVEVDQINNIDTFDNVIKVCKLILNKE